MPNYEVPAAGVLTEDERVAVIRDAGVGAGMLLDTVQRIKTAAVLAALAAAAAAQDTADPATCACVGYTIRTDYGTGVEHDVDRSSCPVHGDTADPADGLSEDDEVRLAGLRVIATGSGDRWVIVPRGDLDWLLDLAARQRPTRQADTDRAVVEAVEAEWFNGNIAEDCCDRLLAAIAAASEPTSGHQRDGAGT